MLESDHDGIDPGATLVTAGDTIEIFGLPLSPARPTRRRHIVERWARAGLKGRPRISNAKIASLLPSVDMDEPDAQIPGVRAQGDGYQDNVAAC